MQRIYTRGFTLFEMLIVVGMFGIFAAIAADSLWGGAGKARDDVRIADMEQMKLALRLYHEANGEYPVHCPGTGWAGPGVFKDVAGHWGKQCDEYIVGLAPDFIPELPRDPLYEDIEDWGYLYKSNGTDYKFLAHFTAEEIIDDATGNVPLGHEYARCASSCDQTGGRCNQPTLGIYSPGYACD